MAAPKKTKTSTEAQTPTKTRKASAKTPEVAPPSHEEISRLAEKYWHEQGRPHGHAEQHWHRAEQELRGKAS